MAWSRGKAYGQDLRDRVFAMADDGFAVGQVAELLRVNISYVSKALSRRRRTGETAARPQCCHVGLKLAALREKIAAEIAAKPDVTIEELRRWLVATHETTASHGLMVKTVAQLRLTHKKSIHAAEQAGADVAAARAAWRENQSALDCAQLIFLDETWTATNMVRRYGRTLRGQRVV